MKFIFGPVSSRRFGQSLGIDLSPSTKQCNYNCLYCELKAKKAILKQSEICEVKPILSELQTALLKFPNIDVITITANGEPTMYPHFLELVNEIKNLNLNKKLLVLSNGSLIKENEEALLKFDICKFSLDAVSENIFRKIDNPKGTSSQKNIDDLIEFRKKFKGELVIEILVVDGINDTIVEFQKLNQALSKISPQRIDIGTIDRPPAFEIAKAVSYEKLKFLSGFIENQNVNIIASAKYKDKISLNEDEILRTLSLRPQSKIDVEALFDENSIKILDALIKNDKVVLNNDFYKIK